MFGNKKGQSTVEYALIVAVAAAALIGISVYMQRGLHGKLKESADQMGRQFDPNAFTTAWQSVSNGNTVTSEYRDDSTHNTVSQTTEGETVTKSEYESFKTAPGQHY